MGALKEWVKQDWVRIGTDGKIKGKCGTSKDKKIQTGVYLDLKLTAYRSLNELLLLRKRKKKVQKVKLLFLIPRRQKSQKWLLVEKFLLLRPKDPSTVRQKKELLLQEDVGLLWKIDVNKQG